MDALSGVAMNTTIIFTHRALQANVSAQPAPSSSEEANYGGTSPVRDEIKVNLSVEGLKASALIQKAAGSVPSQAKEIEKIRERIKELQQKIQEQQAQLQAIQSDTRLAPEVRLSRTSAIGQQLASLNSSLATATSELMAALKGRSETNGGDGVQPLPYVHNNAAPAGNNAG
jgi:chromosome segregation ATPase